MELTPEKRAELREWRIAIGKAASFLQFQSAYGEHSQIVKLEYSEVAERLAEVECKLPPLLDAADERDRLRADLERLVRDACDDDDDIHARCDAILGPEVVPQGQCRTPVAGDDGRVAAAFRKLQAELQEATS